MPTLTQQLRAVLGPAGVIDQPDALATYQLDASMLDGHSPQLVALPRNAAQAAEVVRLALAAGVPLVPRGAGTGISGGAIPLRGGVVLSTARMTAIERVEPRNRLAVVEPGVVNLELSQHLAPLGFQFAPDPSSQRASTIGGNIGENAGGPHCLKYGVTSNHVLALELVLADGSRIWTGDGVAEAAGYDLSGLLVGSEGTFGFVSRAMVRLTRLPEQNRVVLALFSDVVAASAAVSQVIAAGHLPTSLEVMDRHAIRAVNQAYGLGLPATAAAALIVEVDGLADGLDDALDEIVAICRAQGAFDLRPARSPEEQARVWVARKSVAGAIGRLAPAYYLVDTVVPRTRLPWMISQVEQISQERGLTVLNVFHAGDGNLHPLVLYDPQQPGQQAAAISIAEAVMRLSIAQGGVISGEHGIGAEKHNYLPLLFSPADLAAMAAVYTVFNPHGQFNPAKIFPDGTSPLELAAKRQARITTTAAAPGTLPTTGQLVTALTGLLGAEALSYQDDGSIIARPASQQALAATIAACHQAGAVVVPRGGVGDEGPGERNQGSGIGDQRAGSPSSVAGHQSPAVVGGHPSSVIRRPSSVARRPSSIETTPPAVLITTARLNQVLHYEPDDLTITIEAGMTLAALQALLAQHGQIFPLDAPRPAYTTIGALVATAADGPRRLGYGSLRDLLLGVSFIEVDGTLVHSGGRVVKNVSGYDLVKLLLGSYGTLGIISAVSLKVFPGPRASATLRLGFAERTGALALLDALSASQLGPVAAELLIDGQSTEVALWLAGLPAVVARQHHDLAAMAVQAGASSVALIAAEAQAAFWAEVAEFSDQGACAATEALIRLAVLPADLGAALAQVQTSATDLGLSWRCTARALNGLIYLRVSGTPAAIAALQVALCTHWRHSHLLAAAPEVYNHPAAPPIWGAAMPSKALMRQIKQAFDPFGKLNPGVLEL